MEALHCFALAHSQVAYKRITWRIAEDMAYLRPYQAYGVLSEEGMVCRRRRGRVKGLRKRPEPDHPDQVRHTDPMYRYIGLRSS